MLAQPSIQAFTIEFLKTHTQKQDNTYVQFDLFHLLLCVHVPLALYNEGIAPKNKKIRTIFLCRPCIFYISVASPLRLLRKSCVALASFT